MDVIKTFMAALDNTNSTSEEALNEATRSCSNFGSFQELVNQMVSDCRNAGSALDFLADYCGINLFNDDTGAITGADAGGSTVKTRESVVPESGTVDRSFTDSSFSVNGLNVYIGDESTINSGPQATTFSALTPKQQYIWQALHSWWIKGALDLNAESYGNNYSFTDQSSADVKDLYVFFTYDNVSSDVFAAVAPWHYTSTDKLSGLSLEINMKYVDQIIEGDENGAFTANDGTPFYLDATLAHEFTHAVMAANINHYSTYINLPAFVREGIAELTEGIDQERRGNIAYLALNPDVLEQYLNNRSSKADDFDNTYSAGYMLFRYLNKQGASNHARPIYTGTNEAEARYITQNNSNYYMAGGNDTVWVYSNNDWVEGGDGDDYIYSAAEYSNSSIFGGNGNDSIFNYGNGVVIYGDNDNDYISNFSANTTIYGGNGDDSIFNNEDYCTNVVIDGGDGNDRISNFASNSTIYGGAGDDTIFLISDAADVFQYNVGNGNDIVYFSGDNHLVDLSSVALDQYVNVYIGPSEISADFADGGSLHVFGNGSTGYKIAGGDVWAFNQSTNEWFTK